MATAADVIAVAASQVGYREGRANATVFGRWYANLVGVPSFSNAPWCDMFVSWCAAHAGATDVIPASAWVPGRLAEMRRAGLTGVFPPRIGDIGFVIQSGAAVHIFLVEGWDPGGFVHTIEGNTSIRGGSTGDGVYRLARRDWSTNEGIVYGRPPYAGAAPEQPISLPPRVWRWSSVNASLLRLGVTSSAAARFNANLWSALMWGDFGSLEQAWAVKNRAAWMAEPSNIFGPMSQQAMRVAYAGLNRQDPGAWPASLTTTPPPDWPGPAFLRVLRLTSV